MCLFCTCCAFAAVWHDLVTVSLIPSSWFDTMIGRPKSELLRKEMLPTDSNKLLLQWKGPFEILERVRGDDYRIQLVGRTKTFLQTC